MYVNVMRACIRGDAQARVVCTLYIYYYARAASYEYAFEGALASVLSDGKRNQAAFILGVPRTGVIRGCAQGETMSCTAHEIFKVTDFSEARYFLAEPLAPCVYLVAGKNAGGDYI